MSRITKSGRLEAAAARMSWLALDLREDRLGAFFRRLFVDVAMHFSVDQLDELYHSFELSTSRGSDIPLNRYRNTADFYWC
jgi:hypothetical protein